MYTECPNCQTYFKITPNQLKAAGGKVRCGSCNEVFSALDSLVDVVPEEKLPSNEAATESEFKIDSSIVKDSQPDTGIKSENPETSTKTKATDDSNSFADVEIPGMGDVAEDEIEAALATAKVESEIADLGIDLSEIDKDSDGTSDKAGINQDIDAALDGLFDSDTDLLDGSVESKGISSAVTTSTSKEASKTDADKISELADLDFGSSTKSELSVSSEIEKSLDEISSLGTAVSKAEDDVSSLSDFERELGQTTESSANVGKKNSNSSAIEKESLDESSFDLGDSFLDSEATAQGNVSEPESRASDSFILEELNESKASSSGRFAKFAWVSVTLVLFVFLLGEFAYLKRQDLAMYPEVKPIIENFCHKLNEFYPCEISPAKDVAAIELLERNVVSHPNAKNALLITSIIVNNAEFDQAFPSLVLTFSDINQKIIAKRKFTPKEYLSKGVDIEAGMKKTVPIKLMLEIVDPGEDAVNFEFNFH